MFPAGAIDDIERKGLEPQEREVATRALVRLSRSSAQISANEDFVRLWAALRRVSPSAARVSERMLLSWKQELSFVQSLKRTFHLVPKSVMPELPEDCAPVWTVDPETIDVPGHIQKEDVQT